MYELILAAGIPTGIFSFIIWLVQRGIKKRDKEREKREIEAEKRAEAREKKTEHFMMLLMQQGRATNVLAEATARAVQRIPDAHCNGDMKAALKEAAAIQEKEQEFIVQEGIQHIFGD